MASLTKTGIVDGQPLSAVMITELYDAFMGAKSYDNIAINSGSLRVTHNGKISIGTTANTYAVNVAGTISASAFIAGNITVPSGSLTLGSTVTGSFGKLLQNDEIVASPTTFNKNRITAIEEDAFGNLQFVDTSFTSSKFLVDAEYELDDNDDFQPTAFVSLGDQFE